MRNKTLSHFTLLNCYNVSTDIGYKNGSKRKLVTVYVKLLIVPSSSQSSNKLVFNIFFLK